MKRFHSNQLNNVFYLVVFTLFFASRVNAQNDFPQNYDREEDVLRETNTPFLLKQAKIDSLKYLLALDSAIRLARKLGYPIEGSYKGRHFVLQGFDDNGQLSYNTTDNVISAQAIHTDEVHPGGDSGYDLTGAGFTFGVWEVGRPRLTHVEFGGRIVQADNSTTTVDNHASHVCGTLIGSGNNPDALGMAYEANLRAYDSSNDLSEMAAAAAAPNNIRSSNHSYGKITGWAYGDYSGQEGWHWWGDPNISTSTEYRFGLYDSEARNIDNTISNAPFYLPVLAAGNDRNDYGPSPGAQHWVKNTSGTWVTSTATRQPDGGNSGYDCLPTSKCAKNALTVGALDIEISGGLTISSMSSFSSWGPTDDGRIKPDIVARGVDVFSASSTSNTAYYTNSGTSMAAPSVAGSMILLLNHYANLNPGFTIRASAQKALVIHTASSDNGPNYESGWGLMNTRAAADFITNSFDANSRDRLISRDSIANGGTTERTFYHDGTSPVIITIAWTDPAGTISSNTLNPTNLRLVNDLDLRLEKVDGGTIYQPWRLNPASPSANATKGDNFRDNVEQIYEENLPAGFYKMRVTHKNSLSGAFQYFSTMISGRSNPVTCMGNTILNNCSGTVTDGSGNTNYSNNLDCSWTISPPNAAAVTLTFTAFNTDDFDFVEVYNGNNANAPLLGEFDGNSLPPVLTGSSGKLHIVFKTDDFGTAPGWSANYTCTAPQLSVNPSSLNFGTGGGTNTFNINSNCAWTITNIPNWLSVSPTSGNSNTQISINCTANNSSQARSVTITISGCNGLSQTISITQLGCAAPSTPTILASSSTTLCPGQSVTLTATNICTSCTVNWSNGQTGSSISVNTAGNYTATYSNSCSTSSSSNGISVTVGTAPSAPTILASSSTALCPGQSVTLTATNICTSCTVNWSNGQTGSSISVNTAGNYTATYSNSCSASSSSNDISVTVGTAPSAPTILASSSTALCPGQSVTLTATNICTSCTVNWSNGQTGSSISVNTAGNYTATYSNSCSTSSSSNDISVTVGTAPSAPTILASSSTALCPGQSVTLTATNICTSCTVNWSNGQTGSSISVNTAGNYTATYSNSCSTSSSSNGISVTVGTAPSAPTILASSSTALCPGQSVTLTATNICTSCTVNWSNGQTGSSISVNTAGNYTATYSNSCSTSSSSNDISVTVGTAPSAPTILASSSTALCPGQSVTLTATNICTSCTVNWSNGQTGSSISVNTAGNYTATYSNSCSTSSSSNGISVTVGTAPSAPTILASSSTALCPGQSVTLTATDICTSCTVNWSNGQTGSSISVNTAGNYTATYSNICSTSSSSNGISVTVGTAPSAPTILASSSILLCPGQSVTLTATDICAGCTVNWSNGQTGSSISVNTAGNYSATYSNSCGTSSSSNGISVTVATLPTVPTILASGNTTLCAGQSVTLSATNICSGCIVQWSNGQTGSSISVNLAGSYTAITNNTCGLSMPSNSILVGTGGTFLPTIQINNTCYLATSSGSNYQWYLSGMAIQGATGQFWTAQTNGYYTVSMLNPDGCSGTSDPVFVTACPSATEEATALPKVNLYPNPAQRRIVMDIQTAVHLMNTQVDLFAIDGHFIDKIFQGDMPIAGNAIEVLLPDLASGMYICRISCEAGVLYKNLVILH